MLMEGSGPARHSGVELEARGGGAVPAGGGGAVAALWFGGFASRKVHVTPGRRKGT
jgi:hypothetical protein